MSEAATTSAPAKNYLRHNQIEEMKNERSVIERTLRDREVQERGALENQIRRMDHQIESQSPPEVSGAERDRMARECAEIEAALVPLMPSDEAMRKNPPLTVGRHMKFDKAAKDKSRFPEGMLRRWKNNRLALNRGSDDPDVANFEQHRPLSRNESMLGAQIPGRQYYGANPSQQYMDNYDRVDWSGIQGGEDPATAEPVAEKAPRKKKAKRAPNPALRVAMACGAMKDKRGRRMHEKACPQCQEILGAAPEA